MSDRKAVAKKALRSLHSTLIKGMDPGLMHGFYAESLLTSTELQNIQAAATPFDKINKLLESLRKRGDEAKVLDALVKLLEGEDEEEKETNKTLLKKIETAYSFYSYDGQTDGPTKATIRGEPSDLQPPIQITPLPRFDPGNHSNGKEVRLRSLKIVEGVDGGGARKSTDAYPITTNPRGLCVIVNNENFTNMKGRPGSSWDANALKKLFGKLNFHVERYDDLTSKEINQLMENMREYDHSKLSCLFVCVLSHGVNGQIYGTDGELVAVDKMTRTFVGTKCLTLAGKPKVFLIQACRGGSFDHGVKIEQTDDGKETEVIDVKQVLGEDETDGGGYEGALPDEADFLLAYATTPGYVSWRNSGFGTWFIKAFTDTMYSRANDEHLMDILTEVNRIVAEEYQSRELKKQMPAPVTMLRYKLFLPLTR